MTPEKMYATTLTFLIAHQIDAAYWKEWEMFLLPGGIQFFDLLVLTNLSFPYLYQLSPYAYYPLWFSFILR